MADGGNDNGPGTTVDMDQDIAHTLFEEGAIFVFLDVPAGTEFGIDCNSWEVGPLFKGVKMIPPGSHFIYYSAKNPKTQDTAPRTGFFQTFQKRQVIVKKWDPLTEDVKHDAVTQEEQARIEQNRRDLDKFLGVYPHDSYKKWMSMTNHISENLQNRLQPENGTIYAVAQLVSEGSTTQSRKEKAEELKNKMDESDESEQRQNSDVDSRLPVMKEVEGTKIRFTTIPKKKYPDKASPQDITKYNMDHSYVLETLFDTAFKDSPKDILGEMQFAFVCFLVGQVFDGFNQWKTLVTLLCSCEEAITNHEDLYSNFISMLHFHIREIPEDFFVDIVSRDNFLVVVLHTLLENLLNSSSSSALKKRGVKFREHLERKFMWDFTSEPDEYAPVIVE